MPATETIPYDLPVADYIAGLDATGHVTHQSFTKKSVTLHHNGGVDFSHDTILNIWKTRPASAHFDVDASGAVAQYVRVLEYAWATGSTQGNEESISIEMADATGSPSWQVSPTTWKSAARLAAWLFANVIHARPDASNLFVHHHWYATSCAGPYIDSIWPQVLAETQHQYDILTAPTPTPTPSGDWFDMATLKDLQTAVEQAIQDAPLVEIGKDAHGHPILWSVAHMISHTVAQNASTQQQIGKLADLVASVANKVGADDTQTAAQVAAIKAALDQAVVVSGGTVTVTNQGGTSPSAI